MLLLVSLLLAGALFAAEPLYTAEGVVNAASNVPGTVAPNSIVSIYGKNLANGTRAVGPGDLVNGLLPSALGGTGARVLIGGTAARMFYVSPEQLNVLVPSSLREGIAELRVTVDGRAGAVVKLMLAGASPALFQLSTEFAIAARPDGAIHSREQPARPGDIVILYANGLGDLEDDMIDGQIAERASKLKRWRSFRVELDGVTVDPDLVHYVGAAPGFVGLYQINLRLPPSYGNWPEIRIGFEGIMSPPQVRLYATGTPE